MTVTASSTDESLGTPAAKVNGTSYLTLREAVAAYNRQPGSELHLLRDVEVEGGLEFTSPGDVALDQHTLTTSGGMSFRANGNIRLRSGLTGGIQNTGGGPAVVVGSGCHLLVRPITISGGSAGIQVLSGGSAEVEFFFGEMKVAIKNVDYGIRVEKGGNLTLGGGSPEIKGTTADLYLGEGVVVKAMGFANQDRTKTFTVEAFDPAPVKIAVTAPDGGMGVEQLTDYTFTPVNAAWYAEAVGDVPVSKEVFIKPYMIRLDPTGKAADPNDYTIWRCSTGGRTMTRRRSKDTCS
uniref:Uncharacterized protein n=1 Tax=uncultured prokaryote TaxID=198431 RepID=A0A0H5QM17_9ZZZZ|nr:hypothetical protein [uncultured prokaryote]